MNMGAGTTQTPTHDQGEEVKKTNTGNIRVINSRSRTELVQLHTKILGDPYYKGIPLPRINRRSLI